MPVAGISATSNVVPSEKALKSEDTDCNADSLSKFATELKVRPLKYGTDTVNSSSSASTTKLQ